MNTSSDSLVLNANGAGPAIVRNNTILFACDPTERAGSGKSSSRGTLIQLKGRGSITLDSNIIGFADNYGIRAALPQDNITLRNNAFGANLFNHLCDCQYLFADGENWARRVEGDSLYALDGNKLGVLTWPVDQDIPGSGADVSSRCRRASPAREWKSIASAIGAAVRPDEEASASTTARAARAGERERHVGARR